MTSRERVMAALNFQPVDRVPCDLSGMRSTGISAFAYPGLVEALGLPPRRPRVYDLCQMLALPDTDVLDALGCDVVTIDENVTNAFDQPELWRDYDFNGRLAAQVRNPQIYTVRPDGTIAIEKWQIAMPPSSVVFDAEHGGQPIDFSADIPKPDLAQVRRDLEQRIPTEQEVAALTELCQKARNATDKAVFLSNCVVSGIGISAHGGMGIFPMLCLLEPDFVAELHEMITTYTLKRIDMILPAIAPYVDVIQSGGDDWGTQNTLIASAEVFRTLFQPYLRRINDRCHELAPQAKLFIHTCGAIYDLLDDMIDCGYDILNPVQWSAGGRSYQEWKDRCRGRIALWGGGVNAQATLPLGTVADVREEVAQVVSYLNTDGGFVFNNIHNILAEIAPEKVIAMYETARATGPVVPAGA